MRASLQHLAGEGEVKRCACAFVRVCVRVRVCVCVWVWVWVGVGVCVCYIYMEQSYIKCVRVVVSVFRMLGFLRAHLGQQRICRN